MATSLPWYKEVSPTQKKALFAAWLGYVFDGKWEIERLSP
jgi:MFS transporter, SHS family, sialic acid transporter